MDQEEPAIIVKSLSKQFVLPQHKHTSLKQVVVNLGRSNVKKQQVVLNNINLTVNKGEFFGIVGRNGSGKSTLLKILAGVYTPTKGGVVINGQLTPFIELGVGFNPQLSGRDNVFLNGALLGFSHKEMQAMYDDIVEFAELEAFMDQKLKNYSSGMQVRLAFSIAIRAKSDILLIDEVLAVGDTNFQKKCMEVFEDLKREKRTIVFITHSMDYVREYCDRVAVIDGGKLLYNGDTEKAIDIYNKLNFNRELLRNETENEKQGGATEHLGNGKAVIEEYKIYNQNGKATAKLESGKSFSVELKVRYKDKVGNPVVGIMFRKNTQENLYGINTYYEGMKLGLKKPNDTTKLRFSDILPLNSGEYHFTITVSDAKSPVDYTDLDLLNNVLKVTVTDPKPGWALIRNNAKVEEVKVEKE